MVSVDHKTCTKSYGSTIHLCTHVFAGAKPLGNSFYGWGNDTIWIDNVNCVGTEPRLDYCLYSSVNSKYCRYDTLAGVICQSKNNYWDLLDNVLLSLNKVVVHVLIKTYA